MSNDTNSKDHPIFNIIRSSNVEAIKKIVYQGCNLNNTFINDIATPLMYAVYLSENGGYKEVIETLIELGAHIHPKKFQQNGIDTALTACVKDGRADIFDLLALKMADQFDINEKNKDSETLLMMAAQFNGIEMINCILKYKPKLNLENKEGKNALQIAKNRNNPDVIELLEDVFLKDQIKRDKALLNKKIKKSSSETKKLIYKV